MGRGDTGIGDTDNAEAIFYNPAALAGGKKVFQTAYVSLCNSSRLCRYPRLLTTLEGSDSTDPSSYADFVGKPLTAAASNLSALVFRRAAIGYLASLNAKALVYKDPDLGASEVIRMQAIVNKVMTYSLAEQFFKDYLQLGTTFKVINQNYYLLMIYP